MSDKEKEGNLDEVPDKFEAEHAPKREQVQNLIQLLLQTVSEQSPTANLDDARRRETTKNTPVSPAASGLEPEIVEYLKSKGLWK
jgi:hypothetical protein